MTIDWQLTFFAIFGAIALVAGLGVLVCRNPLHSALCMVGTMVSLAVLYLLLHAEFIAFIQIMVYAGAVMMLVVYVIMLLDLKHEEAHRAKLSGSKFLGLVASGLLLLGLLFPLAATLTGAPGDMTREAVAQSGGIEFIAGKLFGPYLLPFEVASLVLTVGLVGAVTLAKKKL